MAIRDIYDPMFSLNNWFGPTQYVETWFDPQWVQETIAAASNPVIEFRVTSYD